MPEWADWVSSFTLEELRSDYMPELPPLDHCGYLINYLLEIGPLMSGAMGSGQLTQQELRKWQENIGIELQPWEIRFLVRLSKEYLAQQQKAEKRDCRPPWQAEGAKPMVTDTQAALRALAKL